MPEARYAYALKNEDCTGECFKYIDHHVRKMQVDIPDLPPGSPRSELGMHVENWIKISDKHEECIAADIDTYEQFTQLEEDCQDKYEPDAVRLWSSIRSIIDRA